MAKQRSVAYRHAKQVNTSEAWAAHKRIYKAIKKAVPLQKAERFHQFSEEIRAMQPSQAQITINRIIRVKKGYATKHRATGSGLDPAAFTAFYAEQCKPPRPVHFPNTPFDVHDGFEDMISEAVRNAPTKKAPGPDLVIGEALRCAPKLHAKFLLSLWRACGRIRTIPRH